MSEQIKKYQLEEKDWKCPGCESNSISLNIIIEHQRFEDQYRKLRQLIRCCSCGSQFIFEYELKNVKIHTLKKESFIENCPGCNTPISKSLEIDKNSNCFCKQCGYTFGKANEEAEE